LLTGSMREFYQSISNYDGSRGIDVTGEVYGWFTMPNPSSHYTGDSSGTGAYPHNSQKLAEDAVAAAINAKVDFGGYDALGEGFVTALFIVHSGRGAEETGNRDDIWSLKWITPQPIPVTSNVSVQTFLTVPEDCKVGVCAHEWGHLAARWADYYDTGKVKTSRSNGLGGYCLMASGSWGNGGLTPSLPNGMLRMFHGWIAPTVIQKSTKNVTLLPAAEGGSVVVIQNPATMKEGQYIIVEYRRRRGQDAFLPDEGVAIFVIDESIDNVNDETNLAIELLQADDRHDLAQIFGQGNRGDDGDLYPSANEKGKLNKSAGKSTKPALNFPGNVFSGVTINVKGNPGDAQMKIDVTIGAAA